MFHPNHLIIIHREKNAKDNLNDFINIIIEKSMVDQKFFSEIYLSIFFVKIFTVQLLADRKG